MMRLVSLTPSNTEIVYALGLEDWLVGVDDHSDYPPEVVARLPKVGPDLQIDIDRVAALEPDLVLASLSVPGMERVVEALEHRGLPHVVLNPLSLDDVFADIRRVGDLTGQLPRAEQLIVELKERLEAVRQVAEAGERARGGRPVRVFWEWWPRPLISPGRASWINDVCRLAGAENIFSDLDAPSRPVSEDEVLARDPDAVCLCWCGTLQKAMDPARVRSRPGWERLRAVREGRIYALPEELFGRPGPRLVEGAAMLAGILHGSTAADGMGELD